MDFQNLYYQSLIKPDIEPPDWIFTPVWSVLYVLMIISFMLVALQKDKPKKLAITIFLLQLAFNLSWPYAFFYYNEIQIALIILAILVILAIWTTVLFFKISKIAGILLLPYILWLLFALYLNYQIVILNP